MLVGVDLKTQERSLDTAVQAAPPAGWPFSSPGGLGRCQAGPPRRRGRGDALRQPPAPPPPGTELSWGRTAARTKERLAGSTGQHGDPETRPGSAWHRPSWNIYPTRNTNFLK